MKKATGLKYKVQLIPSGLLMTAAKILEAIGRKAWNPPSRVKKLMVSTYICDMELAASGYKFHYCIEDTLIDWFKDIDQHGLY